MAVPRAQIDSTLLKKVAHTDMGAQPNLHTPSSKHEFTQLLHTHTHVLYTHFALQVMKNSLSIVILYYVLEGKNP